MKIMKRLAAVLLAVCLMVPWVQIPAEASDGIIFFSDLKGIKVGETFTVKGSVKNRGGNLGDVNITMTYDTTAMKFISGDNVEDQGNGTLVYSGSVQNKDLLEFNMEFEALIQGETRLKQGNATVTSEDGRTLDMEEGYADVQIVEGDGTAGSQGGAASSGKTIMAGGEEYTVASSFAESEIPAGFAAADLQYEGETVKGAKQEKGDLQLLYLLDRNNKGAFYIYNEEQKTCSPMQMINLSEGRSIILLDDTKGVDLPARYTKSELKISDSYSVPAWKDSKNDRFYILYALTSDGSKALYQYDSEDKTYQYYGNASSAVSAKAEAGEGMFGKISAFAEDHIDYVLLGAGFALLIFLILLLILSVKLHRRNLELDDVYDELDELNRKKGQGKGNVQPTEKAAYKKQERKQAEMPVQEPEQEEDSFDDFERYDDDDYEDHYEEEDSYDDDYEDAGDYEDHYEDGQDDYDADYDGGYFDDDYDDFEEDYEEEVKPAKKTGHSDSKKNSPQQKQDDDDDFSIDFIDL